jgi:hypothetical protein
MIPCNPWYYSLPVSGLVEDVITVSTYSFAAEQGREAAANRDHLFWNTHLTFGFGLPNNKFADL